MKQGTNPFMAKLAALTMLGSAMRLSQNPANSQNVGGIDYSSKGHSHWTFTKKTFQNRKKKNRRRREIAKETKRRMRR